MWVPEIKVGGGMMPLLCHLSYRPRSAELDLNQRPKD